MKNQIEFHHKFDETPFVVDASEIIRVDKDGDGSIIHMNWYTPHPRIWVQEDYHDVKNRLLSYKYED